MGVCAKCSCMFVLCVHLWVCARVGAYVHISKFARLLQWFKYSNNPFFQFDEIQLGVQSLSFVVPPVNSLRIRLPLLIMHLSWIWTVFVRTTLLFEFSFKNYNQITESLISWIIPLRALPGRLIIAAKCDSGTRQSMLQIVVVIVGLYRHSRYPGTRGLTCNRHVAVISITVSTNV